MPNWLKVTITALGMVGAGAMVVAAGPAGPITAILVAKAVGGAAAAGVSSLSMLYHPTPGTDAAK